MLFKIATMNGIADLRPKKSKMVAANEHVVSVLVFSIVTPLSSIPINTRESAISITHSSIHISYTVININQSQLHINLTPILCMFAALWWNDVNVKSLFHLEKSNSHTLQDVLNN